MKKKKWIYDLLLIAAIFLCPFTLNAADIGDVDIHGFVSQGYMLTTDNNYLAATEDGTFEFNEMGINFAMEFDKLRVGVQLLSRDLGEFGNNKVLLDWAIGDYQFSEAFGIRGGKMKLPMGLYNQGRDVDMLRVPVFLPSGIYDEGQRDIISAYKGGSIYGLLKSAMMGEFDYEFYYGTTTDIDEDSIYLKGNQDALGLQVPGSIISDPTVNPHYLTGGALRWSMPLDGLKLGYSYTLINLEIDARITAPILELMTGSTTAVVTVDIDKYEIWVASVEYIWNDFSFAGEYSNTNADLTPYIPGIGTASEQTYQYEAWYIQANYRFLDWLAGGLYYSEYYPDRDDRDGKAMEKYGYPDYYAWKKEIVPTLRFDITTNWLIKAEVHFIDGAAQLYRYNNPDGRDKNWDLYLVKTTYSF